jgi:biotin synthase
MESPRESPEYVRLSQAAAMTLGFKGGRFWRGAKLHCINLLQTYGDGCKGACAYCGLSRERTGDRSFIRVEWPTHSVTEVLDRLKVCRDAKRVCLSMVTHRNAAEHLLQIARRIGPETGIPLSGLITPTLVTREHLPKLRGAGLDKLGIAFDTATPELFRELRMRTSRGPHRWEDYWQRFEEAIEVFGEGNVGSHLIVGLGETEQEMVACFQRVRDLGGVNHLFSFFPEAGTKLVTLPPPPMASYRRLQLAAELVDSDRSRLGGFEFGQGGQIVSFGLPPEELDALIDEGKAFMTRGCTGKDGHVACNRLFGNSPPGEALRNYPFRPNADDLALIRRQLAGDWVEPPVRPGGCAPTKKRQSRRIPGEITFFAPTLKHYETEEFSNSRQPFFVPVSVTGGDCDLGCEHCKGKLLRSMYHVASPEELWRLAGRLKERDCHGLLLTGGCDRDGIVPVHDYCSTLARLKSHLGFRTAVHSKLLDEPLARALTQAHVDAVMLDVVGSAETLQQIHRMPHKTLADMEASLDLLRRFRLPAAPHVIIGLNGGSLQGEHHALDLLRGRRLHSLVLAMLMPLDRSDRTHRSYKSYASTELADLAALFQRARSQFPDTPLLLGCARPFGKLQEQLDRLAVDSGFDGIAFPAEGTVSYAREQGLTPKFSEYCCALML